jgi:hypothetical protein
MNTVAPAAVHPATRTDGDDAAFVDAVDVPDF